MKQKFLLLTSLFFVACSHSSPRYQPEVGSGQGISKKGGVVYPVPPNQTQLHMKLVSISAPQDHTLHIRIYFKRLAKDEKATLDPKDQVLILPDQTSEIHPSRVFASSGHRPLIDLSQRSKQLVELVYKLPKGGDEYPYFKFRWTVNLGHGQKETHSSRFDRVVSQFAESGAEEQHLEDDFPYDEELGNLYGPGWIGDDWGWWSGFGPY
jgi:hypothetical protein